MGSQEPAYSQIESTKVAAPTASATAPAAPSPSAQKYPTPKAPVQVEMPAPPPIKYFAGLDEPLVATGDVTEAEGKDLNAALKAFHDAPINAAAGSDYTDYAKPLIAFIEAHPKSNWNAALYLNIGLGYYRAGYYSKVFEPLEKSWQLGRDAQSAQAHMMIDRAVGELARMHARLGHATELETLLKDISKRPIGGAATELIQGAREGLWTFHHNPGLGYMCGPAALRNLLFALKADPKRIEPIIAARSGAHGFSLPQLAKLADKTQLKYTLIHREPGQPIPVPSIINWNVHHYAAIVSQHDAQYELKDPTFADAGNAVTSKAIDAEGSGYFLVPESVMNANPKAGWRAVAASSTEAKAVYGMGQASYPQKGANSQDDCSANPRPPLSTSNTPTSPLSGPIRSLAMTVCNAKTMVVSLNLSDTPLGYTPQKGKPVYATLVYNAREDLQPATMSYSNVGPKWTLSLTSLLNYTPTGSYSTPMSRLAQGGGGFAFNSVDGYTGQYDSEQWDGSITARHPISGGTPAFTRSLADGTVENYTLLNGATTAPAFAFLTTSVDPQGNTTTYNYDSTFRLTSVVDAMGRSTTFTYGLSGYPLLITKVTDPFGRTTQLNYDTSQRLSSITDPIGITSSFTYSTTETTFITQLTTPYGNSTFSDAVDASDPVETDTRSLTLTDPLGYTDYFYFYQNSSIVPPYAPSGTIPTGLYTNGNSLLEWRNTFSWDKHAFALGCTLTGGVVTAHDYTKAYITHWVHNKWDVYATGPVPESIKPPLENRIWNNYAGQNFNNNLAYMGGTLNALTARGRVLDSGASQVSSATYNTSNE
jgi:YD repeat-containing protein